MSIVYRVFLKSHHYPDDIRTRWTSYNDAVREIINFPTGTCIHNIYYIYATCTKRVIYIIRLYQVNAGRAHGACDLFLLVEKEIQ